MLLGVGIRGTPADVAKHKLGQNMAKPTIQHAQLVKLTINLITFIFPPQRLHASFWMSSACLTSVPVLTRKAPEPAPLPSPAPTDALAGGCQWLADTSAPPSIPQQAPEPALPSHLLPLAPLLGVIGFPMPLGRPLPGCDDGAVAGPAPLITAEAAELAKGEAAMPDGDHLPSSIL